MILFDCFPSDPVLLGVCVVKRNFLDIFPFQQWKSQVIPRFYSGEVLELFAIRISSGNTSSPEPLTEEGLITLMDNNGIGTDATIPQHIQTVLNRVFLIVVFCLLTYE